MHNLWTQIVIKKEKLGKSDVNKIVGKVKDDFVEEYVGEHSEYDYCDCGSAVDTYKTFNSEAEARKFLDSKREDAFDNDRSYFCYYKAKQSSKYITLTKRLQAETEKLEKYKKEHSVKSFKSTYVGCPFCGSKLNKGLLKSETCPLCHTELRSKTTLDTIAKYNKNISDLNKQIREEEKAMQTKATKRENDGIYTMILVEFNAHS